MKDLLLNIQFTEPLFLWMLAAIPFLWLWFRRRGIFVLIWRTLILALIIAILADPQIVTMESATERRTYALDLSESISESMRQWMAKTAQETGFPEKDLLFVFGGKAERSTKWQALLQEDASERQAIQPQKTNLEQLFTTLLTLSPGEAHDVFLFTDGWQTEGNLERMFPAIAASGLRIYPVLPAQPLDFANVSVSKLVAPAQGKSGESIALRVSLENQSDHEVTGTLTLSRDGQVFKTDRVQLQPGSQIFTYQTTLPEKSLTSYRANFTPRQPQSDRYAPDNEALAWVSVRTKAKVLLLNGRPGGGRYLEEILRRQGYEVVSPPPESAPALTGYSVVIFNNVEREKFSPSYLTAIERHIAEGNGFIMVGSDWSFGPGGYRHTPVETILPVEFREPKREEKHRAVVLVIDKSGSMREDNRILYAQEAAKAVARQLKDNDLLGVVGFDVNPFIVVPLSNVGRIRGTVDRQVARLKPGGRTFLLPAIIEAKRQLERQNASTKHVIILSDGETGGSGGDYIDLVNVMKTEQKITVSTVAIGAEANVPLMKRISQYGGGFFHHTYDPTTLPQIVVQQLRESPKDQPAVEKHFTPVQESGSDILARFRARNYPPLTGYIETQIKQNGHLDLVLPRDGRRVPLLASWRYGQGRTVAFTTDMEGRWSRNWVQWSALDEFWKKIMDWLRPVPKSVAIPLHETRVSLSGTRPLLNLYLYEDVGTDSQFRFSLGGTGTKIEGILKKLAPGHYQTVLPISAKGDYRINLFEERAGQRIAYPPVGYTLPYDLSRESPRPDINIPLLTKLAQISGGEINPRSFKLSQKQHRTASYRPLRAPLIILCWVLFFLEVLVRKMLLRDRQVAAVTPRPPLTF